MCVRERVCMCVCGVGEGDTKEVCVCSIIIRLCYYMEGEEVRVILHDIH